MSYQSSMNIIGEESEGGREREGGGEVGREREREREREGESGRGNKRSVNIIGERERK